MKYCVYIFHDPKFHVPVYVGMGSVKRPYAHFKRSRDSHLSRLIRKRISKGFSIVPQIIEAVDRFDAIEMETLLIQLIGRGKDGTLLNLTDGGDGCTGWKPTPEQLEKRRESANKRWDKPGASEAASIATKAGMQKPGVKEAKIARQSKPCTIDGITIFPSQKALIAALGLGRKSGSKSPEFRYV